MAGNSMTASFKRFLNRMVQITSSSTAASHPRRNHVILCLSYLLIGAYIFYYFGDSDTMDGLGTSSSSSSTNKAHKVDQSFAVARDKLLSLVNDPDRINASNKMYDSNGSLIDSKKIVEDNKTYKFPESGHAHKLLDGRLGIEIGARSYQGFGLTTLNVDLLLSSERKPAEVKGEDTTKKGYDSEIDRQIDLAGIVRRVDVTLSPKDVDHLPFDDGVLDFVLVNRNLAPLMASSNRTVITQSDSDPLVWDPIISLCEWGRVVKDGGYLYVILPSKERTFWHREKKSTTTQEVIAAHMKHVKSPLDHIDDPILWNEHDAAEFLWYMGLHIVDELPEHDSVQGGFAVVIQVQRNNGMISSRC